MAETSKVVYIVVVDGDNNKRDTEKLDKGSFRYTRSVLQCTLQFMGCKARHAFKISKRVFDMVKSQSLIDTAARMDIFGANVSYLGSKIQDSLSIDGHLVRTQMRNGLVIEKDAGTKNLNSEDYKVRTTVYIGRDKFLDVVCDALSEYKYVGPKQREDLILACRMRERKESVTVLLCGTSGCGKSTLSSLLGSRLGITTVVSTDSIRHMMRSFVDEKQNPLLWASTYHAGDFLDPIAVAEAKAKRKATKVTVPHSISKDGFSDNVLNGNDSDHQKVEEGATNAQLISPKQMAIQGYKAQSEMVIESLDRLITAWEERKESVIVEGVHLSLNFVMGLMKKHPSIVPFMIYITNEDKHLERFAVRAKYMTLDPTKNKYVKYIRNIRTIQEYLCNRADKHLVPKINNTNVDKSVAAIHATLFSSLRRREVGEQLFDPATNTVTAVYEEFRNQCAADSLSSKGMFQLIKRQGSSRHLMALLNNDGSVAKAWPVNSIDSNGKPLLGGDNEIGTPMYGPLQIGKAEPVNLQFGNFGLSAWPTDTEGTSHSSSIDESKVDWTGTETASRYYSSGCSSPHMSDGTAKEPKEDLSAFGSDEEEVDDPPEVSSDEDLSDDDKHTQEEIEGSVDEESTKSDEEYDDLAMQDEQGNAYFTEDDYDFKDKFFPTSATLPEVVNNMKKVDKYQSPFDMFSRTRSEPVTDPLYPSVFTKMDKKTIPSGNVKMKRRSLSIPAFETHMTNFDALLSGTIEI